MLKGFAVKCEMVGTRFSANKLEASVCGAQLQNGEMVKYFSCSSDTLESVSLSSVSNVRTELENDPLPGLDPLPNTRMHKQTHTHKHTWLTQVTEGMRLQIQGAERVF